MSMPSFGAPLTSQVAALQPMTAAAAPPPSMPSFSLPSKPAPQQVRAPAPTMAPQQVRAPAPTMARATKSADGGSFDATVFER